jgi:hypothetical protein
VWQIEGNQDRASSLSMDKVDAVAPACGIQQVQGQFVPQDSLLWSPSHERIATSAMADFRSWCAGKQNVPLQDHDAINQWSIDNSGEFWSTVWGTAESKAKRATSR